MKKIFTALAAAALLLILSGCKLGGTSLYANYRDVEQLQIIQTMGIDKSDTGLKLTISSGHGESSVTPTLISHDGGSMFEAIASLQDYSTREELFYAHLRFAVIGGDAAREGVLPYIDYFQRTPEVRFDTELYLIRNSTAQDLITRSHGASSDASEMLAALSREITNTGIGEVYSVMDVARGLAEHGAALIYAVDTADTEGIIFSDSGEAIAIPAGYGVLRGDKLCGYISGDACHGLDILNKQNLIGLITIRTERLYNLEVTNDKCKIEPVWGDDGTLKSIDISCKLSAAIKEADIAGLDITSDIITDLERRLSAQAKGWILEVMRYIELYDADFLGLGKTLNLSSRTNYLALGKEYLEAIKNAEINVNVESSIARIYSQTVPNPEKGR